MTTAYVVKVYPRFSETFVVTEILGREAHGEDLRIYALRPTSDARFHPELARVAAPVHWVPRPTSANRFWAQLSTALAPDMAQRFAEILPELAELPASDVAQGVALAQQLRADGITHIHAHFASLAGRMAWVASQLTGIPYTVTTHAKDIFHEDVDRTWLRRICEDAQHVIAISRYNEAFLRREFPEANIVQLYNALELARFPFTPDAREADAPQKGVLRIVGVGRLVPKKGFHLLLEALERLDAQGVDFCLDLAGDGELRAQLEAQAEGLGDRARLHGPLTQAEVRELVQSADVFVAPCIPAADGNMDGLPTVVLEAMALGTPVIATAVTGLPEVIRNGETGILLEPGDVEGLEAALLRFARGEVNASALSAGARALIERDFDNRRQARALRELQEGK